MSCASRGTIGLLLLLASVALAGFERTIRHESVKCGKHASIHHRLVMQLRGGALELKSSSSEDESEEPSDTLSRTEEGSASSRTPSAKPRSKSQSSAQAARIYCKICGVPEEYCGYIERCTRVRKASENRGQSLPSLGQKDGLGRAGVAAPQHEIQTPAGKNKIGPGEDDAQVNPDQLPPGKLSDSMDLSKLRSAVEQAEAGMQQEGDAEKTKTKATKQKAKKENCVKIKVDKRRAKKYVTSVIGMENFMPSGETLKDAAKILAQTLAAGASAVKGTPGQPDHIVIQGDFSEKIKDFCLEKLKISPGLIKIEAQ
jgi:density-regulated protein DRP1